MKGKIKTQLGIALTFMLVISSLFLTSYQGKASLIQAADEPPQQICGFPQQICEISVTENITLFSSSNNNNEFGIEIISKIGKENTDSGNYIYTMPEDISKMVRLSEDRFRLIYNVLSSLPSRLLEDIETIEAAPYIVPGTFSLTPGAGGTIDGKKIIITGFPDVDGATYTARAKYVSAIYHEIGHVVYDFSLLPEEKKLFDELHAQSEVLEDYAASPYRLNVLSRHTEDFATTFESYTTDTKSLLERAEYNPILKGKAKFMVNLFSHFVEDERVTYIYKKGDGGTIVRTEVKVGNDGLPFLARNIEQKEWRYKSIANPKIEEDPFWLD